jgi:hypothetical protein
MKRSDRAILLGLTIVGVVAAFWFLALAPKREESSKLGDEIAQLRSSVKTANQDVAAAEDARRNFAANYRQLIALGKAVPEDSDTPSLMTEVQSLSVRSGVDFRSIVLGDASGGTAPAAAPTTSTASAPTTSTESTSTEATSTESTSTDSTSTDSTSTDSTSTDTSSTDPAATDAATTDSTTSTTSATASTSALPTEAGAATLPIGATVGSAGLPVMPYDLEFTGGFFQVADFFGHLDGMVHTKGGSLGVQGRLLTIDGFNLTADEDKGFPMLSASVSATSYVTPADQGILAGADPAGPAPAPTTTSASTATDSAATSVPTATSTP